MLQIYNKLYKVYVFSIFFKKSLLSRLPACLSDCHKMSYLHCKKKKHIFT